MKTPDKLLELYQFEQCPYCKMVRTKLTELGLSYIIHNVPQEREKRPRVKEVSGQLTVPVLFDPNSDKVISDENKIIDYLDKTYY